MNRIQVLFLTLSLCLLPLQGRAKVIFEEYERTKGIVFSGYNKVILTLSFPLEKQVVECLELFKKKLGDRGNLLIIEEEKERLQLLKESKLSLSVSFISTENPSITLLRFSANAPAFADANQAYFIASLWERMILLENTGELGQDLSHALEKGISLFFTQYFQTNTPGKSREKALFYYMEEP